ncbi:MAG TPA: 2-isopropylmalate synthase, partial [Longimicrobiales bacterium]|nr:2-isopropylmalate synthase [Longimicrobiales bacterium]
TMTPQAKVRVAQALERLGVDVIEAGFPVASAHEFDSVAAVAEAVEAPIVAALARAADRDVDRAAEAVAAAAHPRVHTFLATSDLHLERKLRIDRDEALRRIDRAVTRARSRTADVEFSPEDATRTDLDFLCRAVRVAVEAGATTVNIPDTVGYAHPSDFERILGALYAEVPGLEDVVLSVHCHDDLGLAVANTLAGVEHGARQVECTVNGLGERAGNASLEEVVMALPVAGEHPERYRTGVDTGRLCPTSELVVHVTGIRPQPNKAVVGANAFAHEAGIHQHGLLRDRRTYEIMTPELVGARATTLVLGKHSGRHALAARYRELGFDLAPDELQRAYDLFLLLAERKKEVHDEDLLAIYYEGTMEDVPRVFRLEHLDVRCGRSPSTAVVRMSSGEGEPREARGSGDGPIDATFAALESLSPWRIRLEDFDIHAAGPGKDAVGEVHLRMVVDGRTFRGRGASTDIVDAAARAYLNVLDKARHMDRLEGRAFQRLELWGV